MYKKSIFILGGIVTAVFLSAGFASATEIIADDSGDVWHWTWNANAGTYTWAHSVSSEPDIDINEISYSVEGQQVLLKIKVAGNIQGSNNLYYVTYNTTDAAYYMAYGNGSGMCMGFLENGTGFSYGNITVSGDTLIGKTNLLGAGTGMTSDFYGYAYKYTHFGDTSGEWWGDWAPQEQSPWYGMDTDDSGDGGGGSGSTPGFGILLALGAIVLFMMMGKK